MKYYLDFWRRYADFKGKTTVAGFWVALFLHGITQIILTILTAVFLISFLDFESDKVIEIISVVSMLYGILYLSPFLASTVRRLHDAGYSWRTLFWLLVPGLGMLAVLVRLCQNGEAIQHSKN